MELPNIPAPFEDFIPYFTSAAQGKEHHLLQPYLDYEAKLRQIYAQEPDNPLLQDHHINTIPVYAGHTGAMKIRARDPDEESQAERERYLLPLSNDDRREDGSAAVVPTKRDFEDNFDVFTESSLRYLDWKNVVAAGSSVVTSLLPVDDSYHGETRRDRRQYYNETLAPASDVDLFIYGLDEEAGLKKLEQIESNVRDSILCETTVVRTKYAVTIVSQYPIRHVQIVLRLYKSISEILTGFDIDCSCVAYDGSQIWATPRAIVSYMTQTNTIDLSRRSPSYENRLSKYSHRGFEVYCPFLDRSKIDPTIFERAFSGVTGLARLLVLEALPTPETRDDYRNQRRQERGRPRSHAPDNQILLPGNIKEEQPDDIPDWIAEEGVSNYHTFTLPYGERYSAKRIERLLFTKDVLLNAEWNRTDDREVDLHRHPAFFGSMKDVIKDCCGFCPTPTTEEEVKIAEEEAKIYISGTVQFIKDDPGRQEIGSFCPLTADDWTEMAYIGDTQRLSQEIVDGKLEQVEQWCQQPDVDIDRRDHTGRTPLHLAAMCSTPEIVHCLLDNGARIIARIADGLTAFHIAVRRGNVPIVQAMIDRSLKNAAEEDKRKNAEIHSQKQSSSSDDDDASDSSDEVVVDDQASQTSDNSDTLTQGSFVKISEVPDNTLEPPEEDDVDSQDPDIIDPNLPAWDYLTTPLHLAIMGGHVEIARLIVDKLNADPFLPVVSRTQSRAIDYMVLTLVLAARYPQSPAQMVTELHDMGVPVSQADDKEVTVVHRIVNDENIDVIRIFHSLDPQGVKSALCHFHLTRSKRFISPLITSIRLRNTEMTSELLEFGAPVNISFDDYRRAHRRLVKRIGDRYGHNKSTEELHKEWATRNNQPIIDAILSDLPQVVQMLLVNGADINEVTANGNLPRRETSSYSNNERSSVLDLVRSRIDSLQREIKPSPKKTESFDKPDHLEEDETYLHGFRPGSYQYFVAQSGLQLAKSINAEMWKEFEKKQSKPVFKEKEQGAIRKMEAMQSTLETFQEVEAFLVARNAKTYSELYPERWCSVEPPRQASIQKPPEKGVDIPLYQTEFYFKGTNPDRTVQRGYVLLFEAAWEGDVETVKALTVFKWALDQDFNLSRNPGASPEKNEPLEIAVKDRAGYSPFSIAALRGHFELARLVYEIAAAQYLPPGEAAPNKFNDSDDSDSDQDDLKKLRIASRVDEQPVTSTVEELHGLSSRVTSKISPLYLFNWKIHAWCLFDSFEEAEKVDIYPPEPRIYSTYETLFSKKSFAYVLRRCWNMGKCPLTEYAILRNDSQLLSFLLQIGQEIVSHEREYSIRIPTYHLPDYGFTTATRHGRTQMLGQMMEAAAAELPLSVLAEIYGIREAVVEEPKYYQGLSVGGEKKKDWIDAERNSSDYEQQERGSFDLLKDLVWHYNLDTIKWFLSEAPLISYMAYIEKHHDDERVQALQKLPGGIRPVIENWLREDPYKAVHRAVDRASRDSLEDEIYPIMEHLLAVMPETINSVIYPRDTLLYRACQRPILKLIKLIVNNGADYMKRSSGSQNILHNVLRNTGNRDHQWGPESISKLFNLFDSDAIEQLLRQRSSTGEGSHTPLLAFIRSKVSKNVDKIIHLILSYSKGRDLETMDASGEYPLHYAVRNNLTNVARVILEYRPCLLYFENAVGLTPLDLINNACLRERLERDYSYNPNRLYSYQELPEYPNKTNICNQNENQFLPSEVLRERTEKENSRENTWRLCQEVADAHPQSRKLVSLLDANEIVKRLCAAC